MTWYATRHSSGELVSYRGAILVHDNRAEIEWLIPTHPAVELSGTREQIADRTGRTVMLWKDHPDMAAVRWPLRKEDFPYAR